MLALGPLENVSSSNQEQDTFDLNWTYRGDIIATCPNIISGCGSSQTIVYAVIKSTCTQTIRTRA